MSINNDFYDDLEDGWYTRLNHPVALLRAQHATFFPWIKEKIPSKTSKILDIGCGAGLLSNSLSRLGHLVTGIDLSESSLETAKRHDETNTVNYLKANAYSLPFPDASFDVVFAMDILEHVEEPQLLIAEAARVLKPKGQFFFHTFNRTLLSYLMVIKGVEWCVRNTPRDMHVYPLFIKPKELEEMCEMQKLRIHTLKGVRPAFTKAMLKLLATRNVSEDFSFRFCSKPVAGYCGIALKYGTFSLR